MICKGMNTVSSQLSKTFLERKKESIDKTEIIDLNTGLKYLPLKLRHRMELQIKMESTFFLALLC